MSDVASQLESTRGKLASTQRSFEEAEKRVQKLEAEIGSATAAKNKTESELQVISGWIILLSTTTILVLTTFHDVLLVDRIVCIIWFLIQSIVTRLVHRLSKHIELIR